MKSRTIRNFCAAAVFSGCLIALPAHAERVQKFGYVNPERVYTETQAAQRIEATLQKEFGAQQQKLNALQQQGIQLKQQLTRSNLSSKARKQAEAKLLDTVTRNLAEKEKYDLIVQEAVFVTREYDITDRVIKLLDEIK